MGVPKFYRWISERYPKINDIVSDSALLPEFDHLYLDMNGIIHGCTHPSDRDISDVISERDMVLGIMHYLDRIITQIVKPKVSVYMAIDGVAPRAKLNQQRSRRFRSAKDMQEATKDLALSGEDGDEKKQIFDSNCITPGTEFLANISECIKYFIRKKVKEDPTWHSLKVIFSGHDVPGEGEHKIMQHIRDMKAQPNYQPNTRHCIYGQDADLIMLGLVTHEPHFTILREVVDFNFNRNNKNALKAVKKFTKESDFQLLHLSVLREYLRMDFCHEVPTVDLEHVIDDFVFMTFLVGNDFLPHMPTLDIGDGAFDLLFKIYKDQRVGWGKGQYLTEAGNISDAARLEVFIAAIGAEETAILEKREDGDAEYTKKRRKWDKRDGKEAGPSDEQLAANEKSKQGDYLSMIETMMKSAGDGNTKFVDGWKPVTSAGQKDYKGRYYFEKLKLKPVDVDDHHALRKAYLEGLQWCLAYYYRGCISWGWFYPYHYGPMLSDLMNIPEIFDEISFDLGRPLTPFQQLMGCLPPASSVLLPPLYRKLMLDLNSPITQFYPIDFEVDMNGKRNPWEGVNLLPFIEGDLLKGTIAEQCPPDLLSPVERKRNTLGVNYVYSYDLTCVDTVPSASPQIGLPDIVQCNSTVSTFEEPLQSGTSFMPKLIAGTQIPFPGYPSLNVLPINTYELTEIKLNCFGSASKYATMLITLHEMPDLPPLEALAPNVLGKSVFVNWPMMHEAKVVSISNAKGEIRIGKDKPKARTFNQQESDRWAADSQAMFERYYVGNAIPGAGGVQVGPITLRIKVLPLQGMKTNLTNGATKKLFGNTEADIPLQLALWQAPAPDPRFVERAPMTLQDRFAVSSNVVLTKGKYRGCSGTVVGVVDKKTVGVKVQIIPPELPFGLAIAQSVQESNISSTDASRILKIHPGLFGKITGSLLFEPGRFDLGLNLKSPDGLCVVGYTRKKPNKHANGKGASVWGAGDTVVIVGSDTAESEEQERVIWEYTPKAIRLVNAYRQKFPQLFNAIIKQPNERRYDATAAFGSNGQAMLPVIREYLDNIETAKMPRTPVSTDCMSHEAVAAIERAAEVRTLALKKRGFPQETMLKVPGSAIYREGMIGPTDVLQASDYNKNEAPELGDRIVNFCASGIPFGARGSVVGIHDAVTTGCVEVVMDEEFIGGTTLQGICSNFRGKLCVWAHLLKVTPENSKSLVNKLVPKQSGQGGYENIIASVESDSLGTKEAAAALQNGAPAAQNNPASPKRAAQTARAEGMQKNNNTNIRPSSRAGSRGRAGSAARGKQGGYKEALGPTEKSIGWKGKGKRGPSTGLATWKKVVSAKPTVARGAGQKEQALKAMLGVAPSGASTRAPAPAQNANQSSSAMESNLKALLGVGGPAGNADIPLSQIPDPPMPPQMMAQGPPQPPQPVSAAEKLFAMMQLKQNPGHQGPMYSPPPQPSSFNFTYVEEGQEGAPQQQQQQPMMQHMMSPPHQQMQYPPPPNSYGNGYGYPPPPPAHMMPPPPMQMQMHSPPPPPSQAGPSVDEFPPLGATAAPANESVPAPKAEEKKPAAPTGASSIVPTAIKSKPRK